ncbi:MAG: hypothetical protein ACOCQR_02250 [bacterium]
MKCQNCKRNVNDEYKYCPHCGKQFKDKVKERYKNPYGLWDVTTEGDVEGRSVRHLGTHEGYLDEIAFALADQCYYSLKFELKEKLKSSQNKKVEVSLSIESGTWDDKEARINFFKEMLKDRPVKVSDGTTYASVALER